MASEILIIRHGESVSNAARVVQLPDVPLSEQGQEQARRLAEAASLAKRRREKAAREGFERRQAKRDAAAKAAAAKAAKAEGS